jgi:hypothetical protein
MKPHGVHHDEVGAFVGRREVVALRAQLREDLLGVDERLRAAERDETDLGTACFFTSSWASASWPPRALAFGAGLGAASSGSAYGEAREELQRLLAKLFLHVDHGLGALLEVAAHHVGDLLAAAGHELGPRLGRDLGHLAVERGGLVLEALLRLVEGVDRALEVGAHQALHRVAVVANDVGEHARGEHRNAARFLLEDDLQQDRAREVVARLRVLDLELAVGRAPVPSPRRA